jgi:hypothetical protein
MTWKTIEVFGDELATISMSATFDQRPKWLIRIPNVLAAKCNFREGDTVHVLMGEGNDAGKMRVVKRISGIWQFVLWEGAIWISIDVPDGIEASERFSKMQHEIVVGGIEFYLPVWAVPESVIKAAENNHA